MNPRILTVDPALQKVVKFHDLQDGRFAVETVYDVQDIADDVATRRDNQRPGKDWYAGSVPMPMWHQMYQSGMLRDKKAMNAWFKIHSKLKGKDGTF